MSAARFLDGRRDAYPIFQAINEKTVGRGYCLRTHLSDGADQKMQIAIFNNRGKFGKKNEAYDYGFPVSFAEATVTPVGYYPTTYTVSYGKHVLAVSYKVHLSINRMIPERDHVSIDMVIHVPEEGIPTADGKLHHDNVYLKFHYFAHGLHGARKDEMFGNIGLKLPPALQAILQGMLQASQESGVLTSFRKDYHFTSSTDSDSLGELVCLTKPR